MISKDGLRKIAQDTGLALYQQEKDYLLMLFLYFYYRRYQEAIFKGGTCLKYTLGIDRFSEDLDFNIKNPRKFKQQLQETLNEITKLGISNEFIKEETFKQAYTCEISFNGPLFNGSRQTRNKFRIDAGYRDGTIKKPNWKTIVSPYPETSKNILILTMQTEEMFVEKVKALLERKKGRDLYDVWFMVQAGILFNKPLFKQKTKIRLDPNMIITKKTYERDMVRLTNRIIPYKQVKKEVIAAIM
ncbi:hypothetical protein CL622_06590 [archaeon]|nr:hypothetical protein [archaeon]|tara:strand:- start:688 stop:1419 length:732 start_codon:yes stop_codon:yes gene_type:complete